MLTETLAKLKPVFDPQFCAFIGLLLALGGGSNYAVYEDFQTAAQENRLERKDGKLSYHYNYESSGGGIKISGTNSISEDDYNTLPYKAGGFGLLGLGAAGYGVQQLLQKRREQKTPSP